MFKGSFNRLAVALAAASLFFGGPLVSLAQAHEPAVIWQKQAEQDIVLVKGLAAKATRWSEDQWRKAFKVSVESGDLTSSLSLPPMLGSYDIGETTVTFTPQFPLTPGLKYRATLQLQRLPDYPGKPALLSSTHTVPVMVIEPTTIVKAVYPSANVLPENLLKFYLHFSAPMSGGHIYSHIHLLNSEGKLVELPFLEIDEELWNPEMTRLTLFIDPGRIKREVKPLEDIGPALESGKSFTLVIDKEWRDGRGAPLKETFRKQFKVSAPDRTALNPKTWLITPGFALTKKPLQVDFKKSLDHALAQRLIWVTDDLDQRIAGTVSLSNNERHWTFTPSTPWRMGFYRLKIQTTIEDLAGNNVGKPFEVDVFEGVEKRIKNETLDLPFEVRHSPY
jgi:hypothetical protein